VVLEVVLAIGLSLTRVCVRRVDSVFFLTDPTTRFALLLCISNISTPALSLSFFFKKKKEKNKRSVLADRTNERHIDMLEKERERERELFVANEYCF
jgi:hypothetical protein